mgnify:CR=1 FL=1
MASLARWLVDPKRNPLAAIHKKALDRRLRKYGKSVSFSSLFPILKFHLFLCYFYDNFSFFYHLGLRYDDLYDPMYDLDIKEALNRLPRPIVDARNQRLKRAMDLSLKHQYLPEDLQVFIIFIKSFVCISLCINASIILPISITIWS